MPDTLPQQSILERAAEALYAEYENRPEYAQGQMNGLLAMELVRAVLQAFREPSEEMLARGEFECLSNNPEVNPPPLNAVWRAMIDTALEEG